LEGAPPQLLGVIHEKDSFEFSYAFTIPALQDTAELWYPWPQSDEFQTIHEIQYPKELKPQILRDSANLTAVAYLKLPPHAKAQKLNWRYRVSRLEKSAYQAPRPQSNQYQAPTPLLPVGGRFSKLVNEALDGKTLVTDLVKARALYDYVIDNVRYAKQGTYGTGDADYACDARSGNCTEFHSLFIALARTANIPARFGIGAALPAASQEGGVNGYHCWAEFYAAGKWWPVDLSEADKYSALSTYYFGHHPANRFTLSKGRHIKVEPGPKQAIPFLAYPILEVAGQSLQVKSQFSFKRLPMAPANQEKEAL